MTKPTHIEAYVHAQPDIEPGQYTFGIWNQDMSSCGYIPISKVEIPVPIINEESLRARHLVLLRLKREDVYEQARRQAADLDEQIAKIECLSFNPTTEETPL